MRRELMPWQTYLLDRFPRDSYVPVPSHIPVGNMWRHATWDGFYADTLECNGTQMASILSMVYQPRVVVEFGVDAGFTTLQFCKLNPQARVYAVDLTSRNRNSNLPICFHALMNNVDNLTVSIMPSWEFAMPGQVDLCFIDGDHTGDAPWKDSVRAWENRNIGGDWCVAWDDYHENNPDVKRAVDEFVAGVGMKLHQVGSWYYIGSRPHDELKAVGCTT